MDLCVEPDTYIPSIDDAGKYVDKIPSFNVIKKGLRCPCGSRKDKVYETHKVFSAHINTKIHQKWLADLNLNRTNYYIENEQLKITLHNQRLIIAKLEKDLQNKTMTIDYLLQQLMNKDNTSNNSVNDLLDLNL
jgi:inner membrane protein involved in colicin E2 resistance